MMYSGGSLYSANDRQQNCLHNSPVKRDVRRDIGVDALGATGTLERGGCGNDCKDNWEVLYIDIDLVEPM